jgi:hypothetical protein
MTLVDSTLRYAIPMFGVGTRWLKDELRARGVSVRVTEACLRELSADADAAASADSHAEGTDAYVPRLKHEIAQRAEFLKAWTQSDDNTGLDATFGDRLPRIARKYALPRPWRLSEPVAAEARHPTPTYLYWARVS